MPIVFKDTNCFQKYLIPIKRKNLHLMEGVQFPRMCSIRVKILNAVEQKIQLSINFISKINEPLICLIQNPFNQEMNSDSTKNFRICSIRT